MYIYIFKLTPLRNKFSIKHHKKVDLYFLPLSPHLTSLWIPEKFVQLGPIGHLLYKATLLRLGDIRALHNK